MDCKDFKNTVVDLFDKEVAPNVKAECEKHISQCAECREYYEKLLTTAELLRPRHSPVLKREKIMANARKTTTFYKVAAMLVGAIFLSGIAYATIRVLSPQKTTEKEEQRMLRAYFVSPNEKKKFIKERGDAIIVNWTKGTWVQNGENSFVEEHPTNIYGYIFPLKYYTVKLDGIKLDIHSLPNLPASVLKKLEVRQTSENLGEVHLITTPVFVPADVKGNINPELTILLTGKPPKGAIMRTSIYTQQGIHDNFNWKNYLYTSWTSEIENIGMQLEEVAIRKDHHVRVNVCRGVSQEHINRIKKLMQEKGITNYELANQK